MPSATLVPVEARPLVFAGVVVVVLVSVVVHGSSLLYVLAPYALQSYVTAKRVRKLKSIFLFPTCYINHYQYNNS